MINEIFLLSPGISQDRNTSTLVGFLFREQSRYKGRRKEGRKKGYSVVMLDIGQLEKLKNVEADLSPGWEESQREEQDTSHGFGQVTISQRPRTVCHI